MLERNPPAISGHAGGPIVCSGNTRLEDTIQAVQNLDHSRLVIQWPPGAGKSYAGARVIAALVVEGKRVGVASKSHVTINKQFIGAARFCRQEDITASFFCTKNTSAELAELDTNVTSNPKLSDQLLDGCVIGTTAWGFSRSDMADTLDVLVIDEAGQVAVANLVAMSRSAKNLVLMGDQRQLGQPTRGTHPAESGLSVLDYRLGDTAAVDPEHRVFLGTTYRMHPDVNAIVSRHVYADQLVNAPITSARTLELTGDDSALDLQAGIVYLPVPHEGNTQSSDEEVAAIVAAVDSLIGRKLSREDASERKVSLSDILFVAPYNAQVIRLQQALGEQA